MIIHRKYEQRGAGDRGEGARIASVAWDLHVRLRVRRIDKESGKLLVVARDQENRDSSCQPLVLLASIKGEPTYIYNGTEDLALAIAVALC